MNDQEELSPKGRQEVEQEQVKSNRSSSLTELSQYEEPQYNNAPLWLLQERENELEQAHNNIRIGANRKSMSLLPRRAKKRESISELMKKANDFHDQHIDIHVKNFVSDAISERLPQTEQSVSSYHKNSKHDDDDCGTIQSPTRSQPSSPFVMNSSMLASVQLKKSPLMASKTTAPISRSCKSPPRANHDDAMSPPQVSTLNRSSGDATNVNNIRPTEKCQEKVSQQQEPTVAKPPLFKGNNVMAEKFQSELTKNLTPSPTETLASPKNNPPSRSIFDIPQDADTNLKSNEIQTTGDMPKCEKMTNPESPKTIHRLKIPSIFSSNTTLDHNSRSDSTPKDSTPKKFHTLNDGGIVAQSPTLKERPFGNNKNSGEASPSSTHNSPVSKVPVVPETSTQGTTREKPTSQHLPPLPQQKQHPSSPETSTSPKSLKDKIAELENKSKLTSNSTSNQVDFRSVLKKRSNNTVL
ncbi:hypothetical protein FDP41_000842 [Naegleria fowleri]|uniref:Uncharacterized protein n=1 Tax=Naegleria fowleri TaxID=5763 RepID=A0A6A5C3G0_NAEFO|nr:uncharacterized protein FDP41_000842 [Naegleria fowleri]KAF0984943.1 hypothetical protein FDP41_000842 [Naegleria fowleri]